MKKSVISFMKKVPELDHWYWGRKLKGKRQKINAILSSKKMPAPVDDENIFHKLQQRFKPRADYGYDYYSSWERGVDRAKEMMSLIPKMKKSADILEAGCGDAMVGFALKNYGHKLVLVDMDDWRDERAKDVQFIKSNLSECIPLGENSFDLSFSYNTFEHVNNPKKMLDELIRSTKVGGHIYLSFAPLYASPWGMHAFGSFNMPYPQFIFAEDFFKMKVKQFGVYDLGTIRDELQPLNEWRISQFKKILQNPNCEIISLHTEQNFSNLDLILEFPEAFSGRNLTFEDVVTTGVKVLLKKIK